MSDAKEKEFDFEVIYETEGKSVGKMRNEIKVHWPGEFGGTWEFATDEGDFHGGDNTAPPPIAYWSTGFTACIMTQLRAFAKRLKVPINGVTVKGRFEWTGHQKGREPYETAPKGFALDIEFDSDAPREDLMKVVGAAKKGCFIDQTMAVANDVKHRVKFDDVWVSV